MQVLKSISRIQAVVSLLLCSSLAFGATTNLTFNGKNPQGLVQSADFGRLSMLVQHFLETSFGDKIDPVSRKLMGDMFESEAVEMNLYAEFLVNEFSIFKSKEEKLKTRCTLAKQVLYSLWKKSHENPKLRNLILMLKSAHDGGK